jgi:hypothetical protein
MRLISALWAFALVLPSGRAHAQRQANVTPCTTATASCTEWVNVAGDSSRLRVYRTYPMETRNADITRAFILVHGAGRDADNYFRHALAAGFLGSALANTIIIAPRFASNNGNCRDTLAAREWNWPCSGGARWTSGGQATNSDTVTSFDAADALLRKLARKDKFPNLRTIVLAGHSAGGQFVSRYVMSNRVHDELGLPITYLVANPSSYTYVDSLRPTVTALPSNIAAAPPGYIAPLPQNPPPPFGRFSDARGCTSYDAWPYGLRNRVGYAARLTDDQLKKQVAARKATYLLGELDILPLYGFDDSCAAMAQGPTRLARGFAFNAHVKQSVAAQHEAIVVPACGHNARCMFTTDLVLRLIFSDR